MVWIGLAVLSTPTFVQLAKTSWRDEVGSYGFITLALGAWLLIRSWPEMTRHARAGSLALGGFVLGLALALYVAGRVTTIIKIEAYAAYAAAIAVLYLLFGQRALRTAAFPLAFIALSLPLPNIVMDWSSALRLPIAVATSDLLQLAGYPVVRDGLVIFISDYRIGMAEACSGLGSLLSLSAVGLFYVHISGRACLSYYGLIGCVILLLAVLANLVRVITLVLITYWFGDSYAQGALHEVPGLTMFAVALGGVMIFDHFASPLREHPQRQACAYES